MQQPLHKLVYLNGNQQQDEANPKDNPDAELFIRKNFETDACIGCELLFHYYYQPLCSHAVRFVHSKAIAEDIVSEIFYQFYYKEVFLNITTSYRAYLYKAVRHRAYNYLRGESRTTDLKAIEDFSISVAQQPDSVTQYEELYLSVEKAINALPAQRRKIYLMHRFEGKKYEQIACELNLSVRTVEVQIRKASIVLRAQLKEKWVLLLIGLLHILL